MAPTESSPARRAPRPEPSPARRAGAAASSSPSPSPSPSRRPPPSARRPSRLSPAEQKPRRTLIAGSAIALLGLASVGIDSSDIGAGLTILGTLLMIVGIHTFGRLGPDTPVTTRPGGPGDNDADDTTEHVGA